MLIELKVQKFGGSLGVILPEEALRHLKAEEGDALLLTATTGEALKLSRKSLKFDAIRDLSNRYKNALRDLSD